MGWGTGNLGGGSAGLNFKVVGGTSQPSSPSENTIWINTDVPVSGYIFSATEPEETIEGIAWISIGTQSSVEFNALKKNGIQVYPLSAKQYVSGAWVTVTVNSYQNGDWVDWWNGELYKSGNEYEHITGGWKSTVPSPDWYSSGTLKKQSGSLIATATGRQGIVVHTKNKIDLTNYSYILYDVVNSKAGTDSYRPALIVSNVPAEETTIAEVELNSGQTGEILIPVARLSGEYYVGFKATSESGTVSVEVREVRLV